MNGTDPFDGSVQVSVMDVLSSRSLSEPGAFAAPPASPAPGVAPAGRPDAAGPEGVACPCPVAGGSGRATTNDTTAALSPPSTATTRITSSATTGERRLGASRSGGMAWSRVHGSRSWPAPLVGALPNASVAAPPVAPAKPLAGLVGSAPPLVGAVGPPVKPSAG